MTSPSPLEELQARDVLIRNARRSNAEYRRELKGSVMTNYALTPDEYAALTDQSLMKQVGKHGQEALESYPAAAVYMQTCFVRVGPVTGQEIISQLSLVGDDEPTDVLYRQDLPTGQVGDEMWVRLTTGLPRDV